jgi:hypothetical protein
MWDFDAALVQALAGPARNQHELKNHSPALRSE